MVDRKDIGSWLAGPPQLTGAREGYPGQRLGLPPSGPGAVAGPGRRLLAVLVDWLACQLIAAAFLGYRWGSQDWHAWAPLLVFFLENVLLVGTLGARLGHRLCGVRVAAAGGGYPGPMRALIRSILLCLGVPALTAFWQADRRGLHDLAAGTVVVRA